MLILRPIVTTAKYYLNHFRGKKNQEIWRKLVYLGKYQNN